MGSGGPVGARRRRGAPTGRPRTRRAKCAPLHDRLADSSSPIPVGLVLTDRVQRWRSGRDLYRPAGEPFDPRAYEVAPVPDDTTARAFVQAHHYSGSYPAARLRFGLYTRVGDLVGVAVFSVPPRPEVTTAWFHGDPLAHVELGRFVLLDRVRANAESWTLARCFRHLRREGVEGVVSFSDPAPRMVEGRRVFGGHIGTIYQASNAVYAGRSRARTLRLLRAGPDRGRVFSDRAASKLRAADRGHAYAVAQLVAAGAEPPSSSAPNALRAWADRWVPRVTAPMRHPGNHRYLFGLRRGVLTGRARREARPYPKLDLFGRPR